MARIELDTIMDKVAFADLSSQAVVNPMYSGTQGPMLDLRNIVSATTYVRRPAVAILFESPRGFQDMDRPDVMVDTLKAMIELTPQSFDGLRATLTTNVGETAVGAAGEQLQSPLKIVRARTEPQFVYKERYGAPYQLFFDYWRTALIMDPNSLLPTVIAAGARPADMLLDYYSATVLFYETDPSGLKVIRAWLSTNMFPLEGIDVEGSRDITQDMSEHEYTVRFSAVSQYSAGVIALAQSVVDSLDLSGTNSYTQEAFVQQQDAYTAASNIGWSDALSNLAATQIAAV